MARISQTFADAVPKRHIKLLYAVTAEKDSPCLRMNANSMKRRNILCQKDVHHAEQSIENLLAGNLMTGDLMEEADVISEIIKDASLICCFLDYFCINYKNTQNKL